VRPVGGGRIYEAPRRGEASLSQRARLPPASPPPLPQSPPLGLGEAVREREGGEAEREGGKAEEKERERPTRAETMESWQCPEREGERKWDRK